MRKIVRLIKKVYIFLYVIKFKLKRRKRDTIESCDDDIFILFSGSVGTAVLFSRALLQMKAYGKKIYVVCKSDVADFFKSFEELNFVIFDGTYANFDHCESIQYVKDIIGRYKKYSFSYAISALNSNLFNSLIIACINSKMTVGTCNVEEEKHSVFDVYLRKYIYDEIKYSNFDEWIFNQFINVLNINKDHSIRNQGYSLQYNINHDKKNEYCVISPGGSAKYKCWDSSHYLKVVSYILENYDVNIVLSGSRSDNEICKFIYDNVKDRKGKRVTNYCGQTSFRQWIDIVGNAILLIGNDSAAVHIAANTNTDFICIKGQWYGTKYLPYHERRNNKSVIIEVPNLKCRNCIDPFRSNCNKTIMSGLACKCIADIQEKDVISVIDTLLQPYKIDI